MIPRILPASALLVLLIAASAAPFASIAPSLVTGIVVVQDDASISAGALYDYRNYTQITSELRRIQGEHWDICAIYDIGDSWEKTQGLANRDIVAVKISDNVLAAEDEPETLIMGLHHAREWPTSELVLAIAENVTNAYKNDSRISWLVDNREIWLIPIVNPDGLDYALASDQMWRKNRRLNYDLTYGVDLNRNYGGSMNNDSEGEWGGAGTSFVPSDETYCGEAPFSEPEIQAVRDLALTHDFQIAIDFHTYGDWVMWPWGYTTNLTPDNDDLVRIGNEFAALNGYTPEQSVVMYPTTGDSLDWLYGAVRVYPYCIEVGDSSFHPTKTSDVLGIISENMPVALLSIELSGNREERAFQIVHVPEATREYSVTGFKVNATITADRGVNTSAVFLTFRVGGGSWVQVSMAKGVGNDSYSGVIPSQAVSSVVEYYITAWDASGVELMSPRYAPYDIYTFTVVTGTSSPIEVDFNPPAVLDGSVDNSITAFARNLSAGAELVLHMLNSTLGASLDQPMTEISPGDYEGTVPSGMSLGVYETWLTSEIDGMPEWSSDASAVVVADQTAPDILAHSTLQVSQTSLLFGLTCQDLYGVDSVQVFYRVQGAAVFETASMVLDDGTAQYGNWSVLVSIDGISIIEYRFEAYDSAQYSELPGGGGVLTFIPVPEIGVYAVPLVMLLTAASVILISRARRP